MNQRRSANNRKRSHSSTSSSSSSSPSINLFSAASSSDSCSSSIPSIKSQTKKKRVSMNSTESTDSSADSSNTSPSQLTPIVVTSSTTSSSGTPHPRMNAQRSVPAFLNKLYNMVEDISTNNLIRWSNDGTSFIVEKHEEFAKTVLPRFYKHNTFASFVRQLNMYDFHKVPHLQQGVLIAETEHEIWEFSNPHFQRGKPDLLVLVTRKRNRDRDATDTENVTLSSLVQDLAIVKKQQSNIGNELKNLNRDNDILWQETLNAREKYQRHQEAIEKILQFLTAVFATNSLTIDALPKALIEEAATLAGISTKQEDIKKAGGTCSPFSTNALSNILSSVLRLYSTNPPPDLQENTFPRDNSQMSHTNITNNMRDNIEKQCDTHHINHKTNHSHMNVPLDMPRSDSPFQTYAQPSVIIKDDDPTLIDFSKTLNTATKSAQNITQDIDMLQMNIESLATNLGIDPNQYDVEMDTENFQENYNNLMNFCNSTNDKLNLYTIPDPNKPFDHFDSKKESQLALMERQGYGYSLSSNCLPYHPDHPPSHIPAMSNEPQMPNYPIQFSNDKKMQETRTNDNGYNQFMNYAESIKLNQSTADNDDYFGPLHLPQRSFDNPQDTLKTAISSSSSSSSNCNGNANRPPMNYYSQEPTPENIVSSGNSVRSTSYTTVNNANNPNKNYSEFLRSSSFYNNTG